MEDREFIKLVQQHRKKTLKLTQKLMKDTEKAELAKKAKEIQKFKEEHFKEGELEEKLGKERIIDEYECKGVVRGGLPGIGIGATIAGLMYHYTYVSFCETLPHVKPYDSYDDYLMLGMLSFFGAVIGAVIGGKIGNYIGKYLGTKEYERREIQYLLDEYVKSQK